MSYYFNQPEWFALLPVLLIVTVAYRKYIKLMGSDHNFTSDKISIRIPYLNNSSTVLNEKTAKSGSLLSWLLVVLMTTALAQPVSEIKKNSNPDTLRDIIFIIDTSVGMSLNDYVLDSKPVNRLALLKAVLSDFIVDLSGNRIGLIVYADEAYTLLPLTRDRQLLTHSLSRIQPALAGRQNNISNALLTVLKQFDFIENKPSVVILSQGANILGDIAPLKIADIYKEKNIKLHVIGLGSDKTTNDSSNKLIYDAIDEKLLKRLAAITGGEFYWAGKSSNLNNILNKVMQSETIDVKKKNYYLIDNYYTFILYLVLLMTLVSTVFQILLSRFK